MCEAGEIGSEVLRFWESPSYFVVLGYTGKVLQETDAAACNDLGIPILRRTSGGGTVLQGAGCFNYSLILKIEGSSVAGITQTNSFVMNRNARALTRVLGERVELQGHTDLTIRETGFDRKFSGNAQRRKQRFLLFHGTFLLDFDLQLIARVLRPPPLQPEYRAQRNHLDFVTNLKVPAERIKTALATEWSASDVLASPPHARIAQLVAEKYARAEWNSRF